MTASSSRSASRLRSSPRDCCPPSPSPWRSVRSAWLTRTRSYVGSRRSRPWGRRRSSAPTRPGRSPRTACRWSKRGLLPAGCTSRARATNRSATFEATSAAKAALARAALAATRCSTGRTEQCRRPMDRSWRPDGSRRVHARTALRSRHHGGRSGRPDRPALSLRSAPATHELHDRDATCSSRARPRMCCRAATPNPPGMRSAASTRLAEGGLRVLADRGPTARAANPRTPPRPNKTSSCSPSSASKTRREPTPRPRSRTAARPECAWR